MNGFTDPTEFEEYLLNRFATLTPPEGAELYLNGGVSQDTKESLETAGWTVVNLLTQASDSDNDRIKAVKNFLQGVRMGSIMPDTDLLKFIDMEAKSLGLTFSGRKENEEQKKINNKDLDALLNLGN